MMMVCAYKEVAALHLTTTVLTSTLLQRMLRLDFTTCLTYTRSHENMVAMVTPCYVIMV